MIDPFGIAVLGPPRSGRTNLSYAIARTLGVVYISSVEIMRGERLDEVKVQAAFRRPAVLTRGYILDGFPQTVQQALELDSCLKAIGVPIQAVAELWLSDEDLRDRIIDDEEAIMRWGRWQRQTLPVLQLYNRCLIGVRSDNLTDKKVIATAAIMQIKEFFDPKSTSYRRGGKSLYLHPDGALPASPPPKSIPSSELVQRPDSSSPPGNGSSSADGRVTQTLQEHDRSGPPTCPDSPVPFHLDSPTANGSFNGMANLPDYPTAEAPPRIACCSFF